MKLKAVLAALLIVAAGCAEPDNSDATRLGTTEYEDQGVKEKTITLADGRVLECIYMYGTHEGSLDCNWDHPLNQEGSG